MVKFLNYKITNLVNGKVYIGYHVGSENDGYLCSAGAGDSSHFWSDIKALEPGCENLSVDEIKQFYAKNGFVNFDKETIQYYKDYPSMLEGEKYWIQFYRDLLGRENVYNIAPGGESGWYEYNLWTYDHPEVRVENGIKSAKTLGPEGCSERSRKAAMTELENGTHPFQNLTPEQLSERSKKANKTMVAEGNHPWQNLSHEIRSENAKKAANRRVAEGTNSFQRLTSEELAEYARRGSKKSAESRRVVWVFYNPTTNEYKPHNLFWKTRLVHGFSDKLCTLSDWPQYCLDHNLDPNLINLSN